MSNKVYVTGIGVISAIGNNSQDVLNSILLNKSGVTFGSTIDSICKDEFPFGTVKLTNSELANFLNLESSKSFTRTALLGMIAAKEAINSAKIFDLKEARTGLISGTSVGGMDRSEIFYKDFFKDNSKGKLRNIVGHDCGDSTEKIADYLGINDYVTTISTACSSSAN